MRVRSLTGPFLAAGFAALLVSPIAGEQAKSSKSAASAAALTKRLAQANQQYIAAKDPNDPGRFLAAMHIPGNSLMVVSAKYPSPALINERLLLGKFEDAYRDLNSASEIATRVIFEDLKADGFALTKQKDMLRDSFETGGKRVVFDFDWRKQKLTQEEYFTALNSADAEYARALDLLLAEAQKTK